MVEALARDAGASASADVEPLGVTFGALEVLALVLHTPRGRAFAGADELGELEKDELLLLLSEVGAVLAEIAPTYIRSNASAWLHVLQLGAAHPTNLAEAQILASCVDIAGTACVPRPDRYWGVPFSQLLDGHWMAWHAARLVMKDRK
jgi:hypothetical protein